MLRHTDIPILKKEKSESLTTPTPKPYIYHLKDLKQGDRAAVSKLSPTARLASALLYGLNPLAVSSLPPNLSTYSSLAVESSETSLFHWPAAIDKQLKMRTRPETGELQLRFLSGRGQGTSHDTSVMLGSGSRCTECRRCNSICNVFTEFWLIIIAG